MVIGLERGYGSSPSTTLRRHITSSIDIAEGLLDGSLLVVGVIAELHHLLQQSVETERKVINILTWLEGQVLPLLVKCL
jgi:hypothetical protein